MKNYLPIGTIVTIKGHDKKLMICGRNYKDNVLDLYDYVGYQYPLGINGEMLRFNNDDITNVVYRGYSDAEEEKYVFTLNPTNKSNAKVDFSVRKKKYEEEVEREKVERILKEVIEDKDVADESTGLKGNIDSSVNKSSNPLIKAKSKDYSSTYKEENSEMISESVNGNKSTKKEKIKENNKLKFSIPKSKVETLVENKEVETVKKQEKENVPEKNTNKNRKMNSLAGLFNPKEKEHVENEAPKEVKSKVAEKAKIEKVKPKIEEINPKVEEVKVKRKEFAPIKEEVKKPPVIEENDFDDEDDEDYGTTLLGLDIDEYKVADLKQISNNRTIALENEELKLGRSGAYADYVIDNIAVGRLHATVVRKDNSYFLVDNTSKNGTFLNGIKLAPGKYEELKNGDVIRLGNEDFVFELEQCV
ncbi:MAG: DUF4176 domain-containing protein [Clostridium sp.]